MVNMWGSPYAKYEPKSTTIYTADSGGMITNVANNDSLDLQESGCFEATNTMLGRVLGVSLTAANGTDTPITLYVPTGARYNITKIWGACATNLTAANAGVFTAAGATGTTIITNHALSALNGTATYATLGTILAATAAITLTANPIYFNLGTQQAASGTVLLDIFVFGDILG